MGGRLWWDWVKRMRGGGDSSGAQGVEEGHAAFHKAKAVEAVPRRLKAEGKVSSLVGWRYIRQALNALPS